jgi:hypothetical protein
MYCPFLGSSPSFRPGADDYLQIDENFTWKSAFTVREYSTEFEIDVKKYSMEEVHGDSFEFEPKSFSKEFSFYSQEGASFESQDEGGLEIKAAGEETEGERLGTML